MIINETTYVDEAEKVIKKLSEKKDRNGRPVPRITTSKIRNLLAMTSDIYNEILQLDENLPDSITSRIDYLRIRYVYECGRDNAVKDFVEEADIINNLKAIKGSRGRYILFNRYLEALVAYHRFYGGKDQ